MATTAFYLNQYSTANLSGSIDSSQTSGIYLDAIPANVDATKPSIICIGWSNPLDASTAEWVSYTSINTTTKELQGVTRGVDGSTARSHTNGQVIAWTLSASTVNNLSDALVIDGDKTNMADGVSNDTTLADDSQTNLVTEHATKSYVDNKLEPSGSPTQVTVLRQDKDSGTISNSYDQNTVILSGWGFLYGDGSAKSAGTTISFGITFSEKPVVVCNVLGLNDGTPSDIGDFTAGGGAASPLIEVTGVSTTGFGVTMRKDDGTALESTRALGYSWVAIGKVS